MPHRLHNTHRVTRTTVSPFTLTSWSSLRFLAGTGDTVTKKPRVRGASSFCDARHGPALPVTHSGERILQDHGVVAVRAGGDDADRAPGQLFQRTQVGTCG